MAGSILGPGAETAHMRFPEAELRTTSLPRKDSCLVSVRMRQPEEWLPNDRTMLWFKRPKARRMPPRLGLVSAKS